MTNKKLTDNEIVKALECCMNGHCDDDCPFRETREHCHNLDSLILDLINRQKAKVEYYKKNRDKYQDDVMFLSKQVDELQAENERLIKENHWFADIGKLYSEIKAEAYKECIDMVKKKGVKVGVDEICIFEGTLDNLLKELVGEQPPLNDVKCIDCKYLEFKSPYGVCSKAYKGIVHPDDSCGKGKLEKVGEE